MVRLMNAKMQGDPASCALKMVDCLFSTKELVNGNPSGKTKSKDMNRQKMIKVLDPVRMKYLFGVYMFTDMISYY